MYTHIFININVNSMFQNDLFNAHTEYTKFITVTLRYTVCLPSKHRFLTTIIHKKTKTN